MLEGRERKPEWILGAGPTLGRVKEIRFVFHLILLRGPRP